MTLISEFRQIVVDLVKHAIVCKDLENIVGSKFVKLYQWKTKKTKNEVYSKASGVMHLCKAYLRLAKPDEILNPMSYLTS